MKLQALGLSAALILSAVTMSSPATATSEVPATVTVESVVAESATLTYDSPVVTTSPATEQVAVAPVSEPVDAPLAASEPVEVVLSQPVAPVAPEPVSVPVQWADPTAPEVCPEGTTRVEDGGCVDPAYWGADYYAYTPKTPEQMAAMEHEASIRPDHVWTPEQIAAHSEGHKGFFDYGTPATVVPEYTPYTPDLSIPSSTWDTRKPEQIAEQEALQPTKVETVEEFVTLTK